MAATKKMQKSMMKTNERECGKKSKNTQKTKLEPQCPKELDNSEEKDHDIDDDNETETENTSMARASIRMQLGMTCLLTSGNDICIANNT